MVIPLDIRDIPQRQRDGIAHPVAHADAVEACGKFARVRRADEENGDGERNEILQRDVEHVKQLLRRHVVAPGEMEKHMPRAVKRRALIGVEEEDKEVVQQQEHQRERHHEAHLAQADAAELEDDDARRQQPRKHARIVRDHAREGEQQEEDQLGRAGQRVHGAFAGQIIEHGFSGHGCAPPCPQQ